MNNVWHPCMSDEDIKNAPPIKILNADGVWLYDASGNKYIDAISSWWVNIHGHNHPFINKALQNQSEKFAHIMTANFTHENMELLAHKLKEKTDSAFKKVLFTSDGSSAIEAAIKMAYQYFANNGENRPCFISLENAYHGETLGALAIGSNSIYKNIYAPILLKTLQAKAPLDKTKESANKALQAIKEMLELHKTQICAIIAEPLVQCAGGMIMHSPYFIKELSLLAKSYGVFLILDEIAVGFGRTGSFFAYEQAGIAPDILCVSKALGAGYLPIAATLISSEIADGFKGGISKAFLHSHSYTGNALACAVAVAGLELFDRQNYIATNSDKIAHIGVWLEKIKSHPSIVTARQTGMIGAVEINTNGRITAKIVTLAAQKGVFLRPLGNVIYLMPPYCISLQEIDAIFEAIIYCLDNL